MKSMCLKGPKHIAKQGHLSQRASKTMMLRYAGSVSL